MIFWKAARKFQEGVLCKRLCGIHYFTSSGLLFSKYCLHPVFASIYKNYNISAHSIFVHITSLIAASQ